MTNSAKLTTFKNRFEKSYAEEVALLDNNKVMNPSGCVSTFIKETVVQKKVGRP